MLPSAFPNSLIGARLFLSGNEIAADRHTVRASHRASEQRQGPVAACHFFDCSGHQCFFRNHFVVENIAIHIEDQD